jgi:hypothetical protein
MIGASKILTVSYGTFSCTLEGFDDPFNTMKAIAEYFRDLAAEDRYFGAEPPTPDAAMLHRIAEREVQRRVEARVQDNGVILRAADADDRMPERAAPKVAPHVAPPAVPLVADLDSVMGSDAEDGILPAPVAPSVEPTVNAIPEGVAARLAKIRAAVALAEPDMAAPARVVLSDFTEDQHADEAFVPFAVADSGTELHEAAAAAHDEDPDLIADLAALDGVGLADGADEAVVPSDATDETMLANLAATDAPPQDTIVADMPAMDGVEDESDGELLAEIRADAVRSAMQQDIALQDTLFDDVDDEPSLVDDMPAETMIGDDLDDLPETVGVADSTEADAVEMGYPEAVEDDAPEMDAVPPEAVATLAELEDADDAAWEDEAAVLDPAEDDVPAVDAPVLHASEDDVSVLEATMPGAPEDDVAAVPDLPEDDVSAVDAPTLVGPASSGAAILEKAQRARARVIRVRRNPEIAIDRPTMGVITGQATIAENTDTILADAAEAELQKELAALEAETSAAQTAVEDADDDLRRQLSGMMGSTTADNTSDLDRQTVNPQADITRDTGVEEDAVRRLMDQTSSEMAVPENRRRLSSIAHLKAAVAATIAERFGAKPKPVEEVEATRTEPYRNDLARTVRPARPAGTNGASERPAPLVLVSEQRIDRPAPPATVTPVRPRRIAVQSSAALQPAFDDDFDLEADEDSDADNIFGDAKGFAEFADRVGANGLPELLEAAAAYGAAVEGRDSFTRPQLLRQIASVTGEDVTREDELRSFGALLRDGRIVKVKRGQFALTETSTLLAEARKIAS